MPTARLISCLALFGLAVACSSGQGSTTGTGSATTGGNGTGAPTAGAVCTPRCGQNQSCATNASGAPACECKTGFSNCAAAGKPLDCLNEQTDNDNCGACGNACVAPLSCSQGTCSCVPSELIANCATPDGGHVCADISKDLGHCGGCGINNVCGAGQACIPVVDGGPGACICNDMTLTSCASICVDITTDSSNCGCCGNVCMPADAGGPATTCSSDNGGTCACALPWEQCQFCGPCVDTSADINNCGGCGNTCLANPGVSVICDAGNCFCGPEGNGIICPDGTCPDFQTDLDHCGNCSIQCFAIDAGVACTDGHCFCGDAGTDTICPDSSCANLANDPRSCGTCGHGCFIPTPYCVDGGCAASGSG